MRGDYEATKTLTIIWFTSAITVQTLSMLTASIIANINWNVVFRRGKILGPFLAVTLLSYTLSENY